MNAQTTDDPEVIRQGLAALIVSVEDQISDTLTALALAANGSDTELIKDLGKQAQALSDHLRNLRADLAHADRSANASRMLADLRAALLIAVDAIDQLQGGNVTATAGEPVAAAVEDLRRALGSLRFTDLRPAIMS